VDHGAYDGGGPRRPGILGSCGLTNYKRVSGDAVEYEVFARKTRADPLHQVGSVVAPDDDLAIAYARATYDEERWVEMAIVRKDDIIGLWQPGEI
jgi:1,2-phenylacetyl-CoA epoxidase PaaB subunit